MTALTIVRRCLDPRFLGSLQLEEGRVLADRIPLAENEGDVRAMSLAASSGIAWEALSPTPLAATERARIRVRGAEVVYEPPSAVPCDEKESARAIASWMDSRPDSVDLLLLGESEQDTGHRLLPGYLAAELGWNLVRGALSLEVTPDGRIQVRVREEDGVRTVSAPRPLVVVAHESAPMGRDPSDDWDRLEALESEPPRELDPWSPTPAALPPSRKPREREPGALATLDEKVVAEAIQHILACGN